MIDVNLYTDGSQTFAYFEPSSRFMNPLKEGLQWEGARFYGLPLEEVIARFEKTTKGIEPLQKEADRFIYEGNVASTIYAKLMKDI